MYLFYSIRQLKVNYSLNMYYAFRIYNGKCFVFCEVGTDFLYVVYIKFNP